MNHRKEPEAATGSRPPATARRMWFFRIIAISLSLLPFVLLEFVLRWVGGGYDTKFVARVPDTASPNAYQFNPAADRAYYGVEDLSGPDPRPFAIPKRKGVYRIVVVGGSSVAGFPYPFEFAMPRQLELVLRQQMPERTFEVLNAGITAISSSCEVDIVQQVFESQPDLIVVHSGHNEFYGPGGSASNSTVLPQSFYELMQGLRRQRTFQLLTSLIYKPKGEHLLETLPADIAIPLDGAVFRRTRDHYRENLEKIVELAARERTPLILSTAPCNVRDLAPLAPPDPLAIDSHREVEHRMSYHEYEEALESLAAARGRFPADALLAYREAQCLEKRTRMAEAAEAYARAADLDGCRFRAARSFLKTVGEVAAASDRRAVFCDVAGELQKRSHLAAPGEDFFLEHVHYNLEGNWQVASILGECIVSEILGSTWSAQRHPDQDRRDQLLGFTAVDQLAADSLIAIMVEAWPLNLSPARKEEVKRLQARLAETYRSLEPGLREHFTNLNMSAMQHHVWHAMGNSMLAAGQLDEALTAFQRHIDRQPWNVAGYLGAASVLRTQGKADAAKEILELARRHAQGISEIDLSPNG